MEKRSIIALKFYNYSFFLQFYSPFSRSIIFAPISGYSL